MESLGKSLVISDEAEELIVEKGFSPATARGFLKSDESTSE